MVTIHKKPFGHKIQKHMLLMDQLDNTFMKGILTKFQTDSRVRPLYIATAVAQLPSTIVRTYFSDDI
jgi:hypothetical protein